MDKQNEIRMVNIRLSSGSIGEEEWHALLYIRDHIRPGAASRQVRAIMHSREQPMRADRFEGPRRSNPRQLVDPIVQGTWTPLDRVGRCLLRDLLTQMRVAAVANHPMKTFKSGSGASFISKACMGVELLELSSTREKAADLDLITRETCSRIRVVVCWLGLNRECGY